MGILVGTGRVLVAPLIRRYQYFVDSVYGNDGYSGTQQSKPWQTLARVNAATAEELTPTALVRLQRGQAFNDAQLTCDNVGVTYGAYGAGDRPLFDMVTWTPIVFSAADVTLRGLQVTNATGWGVQIDVTGDGASLSDCDIYGNHHEGIRINAANNVSIIGGLVHGNGDGNAVGIRVNTAVAGLLVDGTEFYCDTDQEVGILFWDAAGSSGITLRNLNVYDHLLDGISMFFPGDGGMSNIVLSRCTFNHNGLDVVGLYRGRGVGAARCTNVLVEYCTFKENQGWGADFYLCDLDVINCLFYDNEDDVGAQGPGDGLEINSCEDANIYHNTFFNNSIGLASTALDSGGTYNPATITHNIRNNINYNNSDNDFYEDYTDKPGPCVLTVTRTNALETDPDFVNEGGRDLHIESTSDARGAGATGTGVDEDKDGVPRGDPPDIGAYEYVP